MIEQSTLARASLVCLLLCGVASAPGAARGGRAEAGTAKKKVPSRTAIVAELRGLTQIVLQMRANMQKMRNKHRRALRSMERRHRKQIKKLQGTIASLRGATPPRVAPTPRATPKPPRGTTPSLQRQVTLLAHRLSGLQRDLTKERQKVQRLQEVTAQLVRRLQSRRAPSTPRTFPRRVPSRATVRVTGREYARGFFMLTFVFSQLVQRIEYKLSHMSSFRSTGTTHVRNPTTGKPYPKYYIMTRRLKVGQNRVWVRFRDATGVMRGPFLKIVTIRSKKHSDADLFMRYQWSNPVMRQARYRTFRGKTWVMFFWASNPKIMRSVRYSFGSSSLHHYLIRNGKKSSTFIKRSMSPGTYTLFARFRLIGGQLGPLLRYQIEVRNDGKWRNAHPQS